MNHASIVESNLSRARFNGANMESVDFTDSRLSMSVFFEANFKNANMNRAIVKGAKLAGGIFEKPAFHAQISREPI